MKNPYCGLILSLSLFVAGAATAQTNWTGAFSNDINDAGNWDNGLPANDGSNDGTVPDGFPGLTGNPRDKNITFEGNSGYTGNNFGGAEANGYDITFNGSGDADFTGNGLFLAWDGGAANDSSFTWNSTGTLNTTRWFTSRFGMGTFTQSAGTINQNNTGNFDMIMGEFGAPQDPDGGTTYIMSGGTLNSLASEFEPRFGTMEQSGGVVNANNIKWDEGRGGSTFVWSFSGGIINATDMTGFNNGDMFDFTAGSTGVLNVLSANYGIADAEADISNGWITLDGAAATPADFSISVVGSNTEIKVSDPSATTIFTGAVDDDIGKAANWDNGLPVLGAKTGTVPDDAAFAALLGDPSNEEIRFEGASGYEGDGFANPTAPFQAFFGGAGDSLFTGMSIDVLAGSRFTWGSSGTATVDSLRIAGSFEMTSGTVAEAGNLAVSSEVTGTLTIEGGALDLLAGLEVFGGLETPGGSVGQSGGDVSISGILRFAGPAPAQWEISGGSIQSDEIAFDNASTISFPIASSGVLRVLNSNKSVADMEALIAAGNITTSDPAGLEAVVVDVGGNNFTEVHIAPSTFGTVFTGVINSDINNAGNWTNGLPTNDGTNDGLVPGGFPGLTGNPRNKSITFEGDSGYAGANFGNAEANGYDVTFNGSGDADFTGNGLFLAWDGGAANDSSFTWNSTGALNTTRWFTSRFGMGTFTQSAGTINQNNTGNFDMIMGEFGAPQDPDGGTTYIMSGGTLNSLASEFEPRFGTMEQSGGVVNANNIKWDEGRGGSTFVWNFSGGTVTAQNMTGFNNGDMFNFTADSTGVLQISNSNVDIAAAEALISDGWITKGGAMATPGDFAISVVDIGGVGYTEISTGAPPGFAITSIFRFGSEITLTWNSQENVNYIVKYSPDLVNWDADLDDSVTGDPGAQTTRSYDLDENGLAGFADLFFRVERGQ